MVKNWSFFMGLSLLLLSIGIAWWGLYTQDIAFASSAIRIRTPSGDDGGLPNRFNNVTLTPPTIHIALTGNEQAGLEYAILSEYGTLNFYRSIRDKFDSQSLFDRMVKDETQHISTLSCQAEKYHLPIPSDTEQPYSATFGKIEEACLAAVNAENEKSALFEDLISATTHTDLNRIYSSIRTNSLTEHMPALYLCQ